MSSKLKGYLELLKPCIETQNAQLSFSYVELICNFFKDVPSKSELGNYYEIQKKIKFLIKKLI